MYPKLTLTLYFGQLLLKRKIVVGEEEGNPPMVISNIMPTLSRQFKVWIRKILLASLQLMVG